MYIYVCTYVYIYQYAVYIINAYITYIHFLYKLKAVLTLYRSINYVMHLAVLYSGKHYHHYLFNNVNNKQLMPIKEGSGVRVK